MTDVHNVILWLFWVFGTFLNQILGLGILDFFDFQKQYFPLIIQCCQSKSCFAAIFFYFLYINIKAIGTCMQIFRRIYHKNNQKVFIWNFEAFFMCQTVHWSWNNGYVDHGSYVSLLGPCDFFAAHILKILRCFWWMLFKYVCT